MGASDAVAASTRAPLRRGQELDRRRPGVPRRRQAPCSGSPRRRAATSRPRGRGRPPPFLWLIGLWAVVSGSDARSSRLDIAFAGTARGFSGWIALSTTWSVAPSLSVLELQRALVATRRRRGHAAPCAPPARCAAPRDDRSRASPRSPATRSRRGSSPTGSAPSTRSRSTASPSPSATGTASESSAPWACCSRSGSSRRRRARGPSLRGGVDGGHRARALLHVQPRRVARARGRARRGAPRLAATAPRSSPSVSRSALPASTRGRHRVALRGADEPPGGARGRGRRRPAARGRRASASASLRRSSRSSLHAAEQRVRFPRPARRRDRSRRSSRSLWSSPAPRSYAYGGPASMAERAWSAFEAPPAAGASRPQQPSPELLRQRPSRALARPRTSRAEHRALGSGAGTFERLWQARPTQPARPGRARALHRDARRARAGRPRAAPRDALVLPARRRPSLRDGRRSSPARQAPTSHSSSTRASTGTGSSPGVTLTALLRRLRAPRRRPRAVPRAWSRRRRAIALGAAVAVASIAAIVGGLGTSALANAFSATNRGELDDALADADRARQLMPWSGPAVDRPRRGGARCGGPSRPRPRASATLDRARRRATGAPGSTSRIVTRGASADRGARPARALYPTSTRDRADRRPARRQNTAARETRQVP